MKPISLLFSFFLLNFFFACKGPISQQDGLYQERDGKIIYLGDKPNTVTTHIISDPASLHPVNSELAIRYEIMDYCFERLMKFDIRTGDVIPHLAVNAPEVSADRLTYRYKIREEAAWADGRPITAEDVVFSTKLLLCPHVENQNLKPYLEYIRDVRVDEQDPKTVIVEMKGFYINNDYFGVYSYVFDARAYDPDGVLDGYSIKELLEENGRAVTDQSLITWAETFNSQAYARDVAHLNHGSGPYQMTEWIPEQRIILSRNDSYWGKNGDEYWQAQGPDEIIYKMVRDDNAVELQVKEQILDVSTYLQPTTYQNLQTAQTALEHYHMAIKPRTSYTSLALNNRPDGISHPKLFDDPAVRRAMALALDREQLIEEVLDGMGSMCASPVPPSNIHYNDNLSPIPYDPEEAERLLSEAGWEDTNDNGIRDKVVDGKRIEFSFSFLHPPGSPLVDQLAQFIQSELARVGLECKLEPSAEYSQRIPNKNFDATILSLRASSLPYDFKQSFHSESWTQGSNYVGYRSAEADRLMDALRAEPNADERKKMADQIQEILLEDQPLVYLFNPVKKIVVHKRFTGGTIHDVSAFVQLNELEVVRE